MCPDDADSVIHVDIPELDYARLHERSVIDDLALGFPCKDFSIVGECKGITGNYGPLYIYGPRPSGSLSSSGSSPRTSADCAPPTRAKPSPYPRCIR
ncbi:DNA cytosine methyltransferase [Kocuria varians]|uniref:DNA cytosine methyltransferase n=1 Tax=Kocuria varians TaxID=1272 RepID=UPI0037BF9A10